MKVKIKKLNFIKNIVIGKTIFHKKFTLVRFYPVLVEGEGFVFKYFNFEWLILINKTINNYFAFLKL